MDLTNEQMEIIRHSSRDEEAFKKILESLHVESDMPAKRRVLVVDDDKQIGDLVRFALEPEGFNVITVLSGKEALYEIHNKKMALILLDIILPDINGGDILLKIRESALNKDAPVVFITGMVKPGEEDKLTPRAEKYLGKPFTTQKLVALARELMG
ncbi:MAG: response regulator [bacterium]